MAKGIDDMVKDTKKSAPKKAAPKKAAPKKAAPKKAAAKKTSSKNGAGCAAGNTVSIEYTGSFEDGTVFDSSEKVGKPLEFQLGVGMVIKGFENAITGMKVGEEKEVTIKPEEGYGMPNPQLVREVPKPQVPEGKELKPGLMMLLSLPNGQRVPAKIVKVGDSSMTIDLNHPLAGRVLQFKIKLVGIN